MAAPAGATHQLVVTVPSANVPATLTGWSDRIVVCDVPNGVNADAASFVAGLTTTARGDGTVIPGDLEITDAAYNPLPWRVIGRGARVRFDQTPGAEVLDIRVRHNLSTTVDNVINAFRGCTAPAGEALASDVTWSTAILHCDFNDPNGATLSNWADDGTVPFSYGTLGAPGVVGTSVTSDAFNRHVSNPTGITLDTQLATSPGYTMLAWGNALAGKAFGGVGGRWGFYGRADVAQIRFNNGTTFVVITYATANVWNLVAVTLDPAIPICNWYRHNGTGWATGTAALNNSAVAAPVVIGGDALTYNHGLIGSQDETIICTGVWSALEITAYQLMTRTPATWASVAAEVAVAGGAAYRPWLITGGRMR